MSFNLRRKVTIKDHVRCSAGLTQLFICKSLLKFTDIAQL
jgi:hypothetical protein